MHVTDWLPTLTALVDVPANSSFAIATLSQENGTITQLHPSFAPSGGGMSGGCNAGFDGKRYYKSMADGYLYTLDATSGVSSRSRLRDSTFSTISATQSSTAVEAERGEIVVHAFAALATATRFAW